MSKEFPLLVAAAMARAYRSGEKTQTRRVVEANGWNPNDYKFACVSEHDSLSRAQAFFTDGRGTGCKYGKVGGKMWLREMFAIERHPEGQRIVWTADMSAAWVKTISDVSYLASDYKVGPGKPNIHMPREYCQTVLTINALRVERLQAITDQDALSEGVLEWFKPRAAKLKKAGIAAPDRPRFLFELLWTSLYGQAAWDANPYVWVICTDKVHNAT